MKYKAIIIDDEPLACSIVEEYLKTYEIIEVVAKCHDGFQGIKAIAEHNPNLIFLDVQMPKITGFEMLELIDEKPGIIFTTAFDEYAIKAFESNAVDYLLKPFSEDRFDKAMDKFLSNRMTLSDSTDNLLENISQEAIQNRIVIKDGSKIRILPLPQIIHIEADDDYVKIVTEDGAFMKKKTLSYYESTLPADQFIRTHRSHLLNISHITRIEPYEKHNWVALLKNGSKVSVSKNGYKKLKAILDL